MKRVSLFVLAVCVMVGVFAIGTSADELVFLAPVVGSNPGETIAGVGSGGAPWVVRRGLAVLTDDGRLSVDVRGLVLPSVNNTAGPITGIAASVVCANVVVATSNVANLTSTGDAEIHAKLSVALPCVGAVVLVRVAAVNGAPLPAAGPFIAATGLAAGQKDDQDHDKNDDRGNDR
ncbi:MAG TPA: hypothetical protein VH022_01810 [Candidatus Acidoferrum sp.]|jgi:hypothetical protein|nr:hypothetical protein [Candidatus Acidoferrum sp.]